MTPTYVTSDTRQEVAEGWLRQVVLPETVKAQIHHSQRSSNEYINQRPFSHTSSKSQHPHQQSTAQRCIPQPETPS